MFERDPFAVLGPHRDETGAWLVRTRQPAAQSVAVRLVATDQLLPMNRIDREGLYELRLSPAVTAPVPDYRLRVSYTISSPPGPLPPGPLSPGPLPPGPAHVVEIDDPYRYGRVLTDFDLHLFGEGTHRRLFDKLGAHRITIGTTVGVHFAVWAPNADRVSVVGDFNGWDGRVHGMRLLVPGGVWEIFVPDLPDGEKYKFEIRTRHGALLKKSDPFGVAFEVPPQSASIVRDVSTYVWRDQDWIRSRARGDAWLGRPMSVYEVHLGSWARVPEESNRPLTYRELAHRLVPYVKDAGFTHI